MRKFLSLRNITLTMIVFIVFSGGIILLINDSIPLGGNTYKDPVHTCIFFNEYQFFTSINNVANKFHTFHRHILGGIIPHHLLAGHIIADFFHTLKGQKIDTIILIGPNHYERGERKMLTSPYPWNTPFGTLFTDKGKITQFLNTGLIGIDYAVMNDEHSISGLIPYIKYFLPNAKVVPIILWSIRDKKTLRTLVDNIFKIQDRHTVIICSTDFSHYLSAAEAGKRDEITLKTIRNNNYEEILMMNNDFVDSPASLYIFLKVMEKNGSHESKILFHTNSGEILQKSNIQVTSYFSIIFFK